LPVFQLSLFDIEPRKTQDQWMTTFEHFQIKKRSMSILVYFYGNAWEEKSSAYSFVPKNKTHSYEEGVSEGYNKLPSKIEKKMQ